MDFKERLAVVTKRNRSLKHKPWDRYTHDQKLEVVSQWLILGNMRQVAVLTGIPYDTVRKWKGEAWWGELEAEIRASQNIQMDNNLSTIVGKSLEAVHDRIANGDYFYDQKTGEIKRKPVQLKDVHKVAVDLLTKMEVMREGQKNRNEGTQISVEEHLKMLAYQMAQWFEPKKELVTIEEDIEDAIPKRSPESTWEGELSKSDEGSPVGIQESIGTEVVPKESGNPHEG